jgi:hypothetical protein
MSYFHEYSNKRNRKTLRSYSVPLDLRRIDPQEWVTSRECWPLHDRLLTLRHFALIGPSQAKQLAPRDAFERRITRMVQYPRPLPRQRRRPR